MLKVSTTSMWWCLANAARPIECFSSLFCSAYKDIQRSANCTLQRVSETDSTNCAPIHKLFHAETPFPALLGIFVCFFFFFHIPRKTSRGIWISTANPKSGQADKIFPALESEMSLHEATCIVTASSIMLLGALFNNSTNVDAKWKKFVYVWSIRHETIRQLLLCVP